MYTIFPAFTGIVFFYLMATSIKPFFKRRPIVNNLTDPRMRFLLVKRLCIDLILK